MICFALLLKKTNGLPFNFRVNSGSGTDDFPSVLYFIKMICIIYLHTSPQDVLEELDPSIEPVLSKAIIKQGNREVVRLGDKELDWSHDFRLYITTKLGNPHYTPEVAGTRYAAVLSWSAGTL